MTLNYNKKESVLEAVKRNGWALQYASDKLKADRKIVLEAVKQNGEVLQFASKELKADRKVVLEADKKIALELAKKRWLGL